MNNTIYLSLLCAILFTSCAPKIIDLQRNEQTGAYEATIHPANNGIRKQAALRSVNSKALVVSREAADSLATLFNAGGLESIGSITIQTRKSPNFVQTYNAGKQYFQAVEDYKKGHYKSALSGLNEALQRYPDLRYFSDTYFLLGLSQLSLGDTIASEQHFVEFLRYSESKIPEAFHLVSQDHLSYDSLLALKALPERHITNIYTSPAMPRRSIPGFLYPRGRAYLLLGGSTVDGDFQFEGSVALSLALSESPRSRIQYKAFASQKRTGLEIDYPLLQSEYNTMGFLVKGGMIDAKQSFEEESFEFNQYYTGYDLGYFVHPRLGLYSGANIYRYTADNPFLYEGEELNIRVWNDHLLYAGATFFFLHDLGVSFELNSQGHGLVGLYMGGGNFWFNNRL